MNEGLPDLNKAITDTLVAAHENLKTIVGGTLIQHFPKTLAALRSVPPQAQIDYAIPLIRNIVTEFDMEYNMAESSYLDTSISVCISDMFDFIIQQENRRLDAAKHDHAVTGMIMPNKKLVT